MEDKRRIAASLRLCSDVPLKCDKCVEEFGIGCATRLRIQAAEAIEDMARELETARTVNKSAKNIHSGRNAENGIETTTGN